MSEQHPLDDTATSSENAPEEAGGINDDGGTDEPAEPSLDERLQALAEESNAAKDQALRAQAELENYRKRMQRELAEERKYAALAIVRDLLPGLDNLQRAIDAGESVEDLSAMLQGVEMVAEQFRETLARHGTTVIEAVGQPFDPNKHEAIQQMPSADHPPMTVIDEVERGYELHDRVIRPSKVIVSVAPPEDSSPDS